MEEQHFDWLDKSSAWAMRITRWHPALGLPAPILLGVLVATAIRLHHRPFGLVAGILACGLVAWLYGTIRTSQAIMASLLAAVDDRDEQRIASIRQLIEGQPITRSDYMLKHVGDAEVWMGLRRFDRAAAAYEQIDLEVTPRRVQPGLYAGHALALAHLGETDRALAMIEEARADADAMRRYPADKRMHLEQRRGVILSLAGRHEEAIAVLERFEDDEDSAWLMDLIEPALARSRAALRAAGRSSGHVSSDSARA